MSFGTTPFIERVTYKDKAFKDAMDVRIEVFVREQHCSLENEEDDFDKEAMHWVVYASIGNSTKHDNINSTNNDDPSSPSSSRMPVGTIRLISPKTTKKPYVTIGRLAVLKPFRGLGLARLLVDEAAKYAEHGPETFDAPETGIAWDGRALIHAQKNAQPFWEKTGFQLDESMGEWDEEGLVHVGMWRNVRGERRRSSVMLK